MNRYNGWYHLLSTPPSAINESLIAEVLAWRQLHPSKPVVVTEYGAEGLPGMSALASSTQPFTEQYQLRVLQANHAALDWLRQREFVGLAGEMVWNFADFMTAPDLTRPGGNHKGVMTRLREPKAAAYLMKGRYELLPDS